jgi:hypothetical protein
LLEDDCYEEDGIILNAYFVINAFLQQNVKDCIILESLKRDERRKIHVYCNKCSLICKRVGETTMLEIKKQDTSKLPSASEFSGSSLAYEVLH